MTLRRFGAIFLTAISLVGAATLSAPARAAGAPTRCFAFEITHDVNGDLVVPANDWCDLSNITVHGNVTVARNAFITLQTVHVDGNLTVATSGGAAVLNGDIAGSVLLTHALRLDLDGTVQGDVVGTLWAPLSSPPTPYDGPLLSMLFGPVIYGNVDVSAPLNPPYAVAEIDQITVDGSMRLSGMEMDAPGYISVGGSLVLNRLQGPPASDAPNLYPAEICGLQVTGDATIEYSPARMNWGGLRACGYRPNEVGGALLLHDNTGPIQLSGSISGDLVCRRNLHHPHPLHTDNPALVLTVGGHAIGQCANLEALRP